MDKNSNQPSEIVKLLPDIPAEKDILDYRAYCDTIVAILKGLPSKAPFTMGVFGNWGSGKTTLLKMIRNELTKDKFHSIWVNVWKIGSNEEDVWKAFLQAVLINVKKELPWYKKWLFHIGVLQHQIEWSEVRKKLPEVFLRIAIVIVPLYLSLANLNLSNLQISTLSSNQILATAGIVLSTVLGWFIILQPYLEAIGSRVKIDLQGLVITSPLKKRVSVLDEFNKFFEIMTSSLVGENGKLVVFIDDLDRCPPERITQVLDSIKLFLDFPNCIYIIGLDRDVIEQAITIKFANYKEPKSEAREYLEKIISLPFDLPPLSGQQMEDLVAGLETSLPEPDECKRVFALGQEPNPRKVKRTINTFLLLWALANRRTELIGVIKPIRLSKLVVIQHSYRDFYMLLDLFPQYLGELEAYFRKSNLTQDSHDENEGESAKLPAYLEPFTKDNNLCRLLTLHPTEGKYATNTNFVNLRNGEFIPLPEDEVRNYIRLARSINANQSPLRAVSHFVNRVSEMEAFSSLLRKDSPRQIFSIEAPGGMGKTSLVQQYSRICQERNIPVAIVEMYDVSSHTLNGVMERIATQLGGSILRQFSKNQNEFQSTSEFLEILKQESEQSKCVIIFDTYEAAPPELRTWVEKELLKAITEKTLPNVVVGLSGRETKLLDSSQMIEHEVLRIKLAPFSPSVTKELLKQLGVALSEESFENLSKASGGNPVLTALLAEQLKKEAKSDESE